ncbi:mitochondrial carrier [Lactifluus volemus]|nr:mitochondrial carrier [Lactifluus volemus]
MEATTDDISHQAHDRGSPAMRAAKDITFGSVRQINFVHFKIFEHPFDLTKVRLQTQVLDATARFHGPLDCLVQTFRNEGVRGLYRGLPAPIVGAMAENATLFLAYGELQSLIRVVGNVPATQALSLPQLALAAAGAGSITSVVLTPIELVKCKMQVQMLAVPAAAAASPLPVPSTVLASVVVRNLPGPYAILRDVIRADGFRGLWLGQMGTLIRETGGSAAWFGTKELVSKLLRRNEPERQLRPWESALSGACAGAAYNLAFFPADTVKNRGQRSFGAVAKELYRAQGVRGLYAGCGITVARSIPSSALIFWIYDGLRARFG